MWIGRQASGLYMLTANKPILYVVQGSNHFDLYVPYGDPIGVRHLCKAIWSSLKISDIDLAKAHLLKKLEMVEIEDLGSFQIKKMEKG